MDRGSREGPVTRSAKRPLHDIIFWSEATGNRRLRQGRPSVAQAATDERPRAKRWDPKQMNDMKPDMSADVLAELRALPDDILADLPVLLVNRQGSDDEAYMRTENVIGHVEPGKLYRVTWRGLSLAGEDVADPPLPKAAAPPHVVLKGKWRAEIDLSIEDANILGGFGSFVLPEGKKALTIPVADSTPENLAFYDSRLVKVGETVRFDAAGNLPVTITSVGRTYVENYLMDPAKGGGNFVEVHDRPHFHLPLHDDAAGYLIIGKKIDAGNDVVSGFRIPYGYGIAIAPWAIHSDANLIGRYLVIYSVTAKFSTVILRRNDGSLAPIDFVVAV